MVDERLTLLAEDRQYSRAFENFVQDSDYVVGLFAYALFKRSIWEDSERGLKTSGSSRDPSVTVVETYRSAAERRITEVIDRSLEAAKSELQISAATDAISNARLELTNHITNRTSFGQSFLVNFVAWGFTLFITALILILSRAPDPQDALSNAAEKIIGPASRSASAR